MTPRTPALLVLGLLAAGCAPAPPAPEPAAGPAVAAIQERAREIGELHDRHRHPALAERRFGHADFWDALGPVVDASPHLSRELLGRSVEGREIQGVRYGEGPVRVLLWSQMHGDESTATRALLDLFHLISRDPDDPLARRLRETLTIEAIPLLNPDGAERFRRRNAQGIDVNRDARQLVTPEGRILREAQRRFDPQWGFNLHDQNVRTRVARTDRIAAIALLAPPYDQARSVNPVRAGAKRLAAVMRDAVEPFVTDHIAQYDDTYNPRAFGDGMQRWGTSTVLLEAGAWRDDPEKAFLRKVNFVAIASALEAIATGAVQRADETRYTSLPFNGPAARDLLVRGAIVVPPGGEPFRADLAVNYAEPLRRQLGSIADVGDLDGAVVARDTLRVEGAYLHLHQDAVEPGRGGIPVVAVGRPARFVVREGPRADSRALWRMEEGAPVRVTGR